MKIIDMHCDTISRICQERGRNNNCHLCDNSLQVDLMKMKSSNYLLQNFALFIDLSETDCPEQAFLQQLAIFKEEMTKNSHLIAPVTRYCDIVANEKMGKMSALMTLEEGEVCSGDLDKLQEVYNLGIRMMTFTWNYPNSLGFPAEPAPLLYSDLTQGKTSLPFSKVTIHQEKGLTSRGKEFLEQMEHLGIIPDVSHLSDLGIRDVCKIAKKPFCASHSNARALCHRGRNLPDELIRAIAEKGGVIGANYYGPFLTDIPDREEHYFSYVKDIALHIRHIADIGGISCIGLGSDFDGIDQNLEIKNCSHMELLEHELKKCNFKELEIEQIFYRNVLNFYHELL